MRYSYLDPELDYPTDASMDNDETYWLNLNLESRVARNSDAWGMHTIPELGAFDVYPESDVLGA